jgi:putative ABC transport system permease protein
VSSWRTALRIARREARRSRGRSLLVVAMIGLPVLFLAFTAVSYDMFTPTGAEAADRTMGAASARIQWSFRSPVLQLPNPYEGLGSALGPGGRVDGQPKPTVEELVATLGPGTRAIPLQRGTTALRTAAGIGELNTVGLDASDPLAHGYVTVLAGRAPTTAGEVALTEQAMARLGAAVGGTVTTAAGDRTYTVVGRVEFPAQLRELVLFAPTDETSADVSDRSWLVATAAPIAWSDVLRLNQLGMVVASRAVFEHPPPADQVPFKNVVGGGEELTVSVLIGGLGLLEIVLLAGPAFAVGARRRQRQLALIAANGGTPAHIRRIVLADGIVLGLAGAVAGIVAGVVAAFAFRPYAEDLLMHTRAGGYRVFPSALAAIAVLAVATGLLAALVPAFVTARQDVVASLSGRRGITRSKKRWLALGLTMVASGTAVVMAATQRADAEVILVGLVVGELGLVLCTPSIVGIVARAGRVLPLTARIALRDAARNRAAAAPAIAAVMAAVAGSVTLGLYLDSARTYEREHYLGTLALGAAQVNLEEKSNAAPVESALRQTLPVDAVYPVSDMTCAGPPTEDPCYLSPLVAPGRECPYLETLRQGQRELTADERRRARADERCDLDIVYGRGDSQVDDGTALAALTGATGEDLDRARATLRAGGIVVRQANLINDGLVTVAVVDARGLTNGSADPTLTAPRLTFPGYLLTTGAGPGPTVISPGAVAEGGPGYGGEVAGGDHHAGADPGRVRRPRGRAAGAAPVRLRRARPVRRHRPTAVAAHRGGGGHHDRGGRRRHRPGRRRRPGRPVHAGRGRGARPGCAGGLSVSQSGVIALLGSGLGVLAGLGHRDRRDLGAEPALCRDVAGAGGAADRGAVAHPGDRAGRGAGRGDRRRRAAHPLPPADRAPAVASRLTPYRLMSFRRRCPEPPRPGR